MESLRALLDAANPPELGPGPRPGTLPMQALRQRLDAALASGRSSGPRAELIRALVYLWHDHLQAAHGIAQSVEDEDGSYLHALMHRREPDYENAKYWLRRAGRHECHAELARRAEALLRTSGDSELAGRLVPRGEWDAFAFVDACHEAAESSAGGKGRTQLLREIQRAEFEVQLNHLADAG